MKQGFTLVEIMTAVSIFLLVMTISMGAIVGVFDANRKSQSMKAVMSNLNLSVESLSRELRFGRNYHCCNTSSSCGAITSPNNCPSGGNLISFTSNDGLQVVYRMAGTAIEKSIDGGASYTRVTAPEVTVESLTFYVLGAGAPPANILQPRSLIKIKGYAGVKPSARTDFSLQTLVSQRLLDL